MSDTNRSSVRLLALALGLVTLALYVRCVTHDFLWYDDQQYVTENARVQAGLTGPGLVWAFGFHASNWHPLTWISHMLDCQWYGLKPAGHHLTNVLLHVANTLLLFLVLHRLTKAPWRGALVAALFAWHPLHVESVAWIAERKDVLSCFFWMLTLWAYTHYVAALDRSNVGCGSDRPARKRPAALWYGATLSLFALGLMSKPMVVTLPFVLLLLDFWPLRRVRTHQATVEPPSRASWLPLLEKVPFFALSAVACVLTVAAQQQGFSIVSTSGLPFSNRLLHALVAYAHYLSVTFLPRGLGVYYPYERPIPVIAVGVSAALLVLVTWLVIRFGAHRRYLVTGWFWYVGTLIPVIGLVQVGDQAWADRYTYLPLIGIFLALVWGGFDLAGNRPAARFVAAGALAALLVSTSIQLSYWKDTRSLFEHTARVTRNNYMAVTVLGSLLAKEGKIEEAVDHYQTALRYKPGLPEARFFLGNALEQQGKLDEAVQEYEGALRSGPLRELTRIRLGVVSARQGNYTAAAQHYTEALRLNPESDLAHHNLARLLQTQGRVPEAIDHYLAALRLNPKLAQAHNNLGILFLQAGRIDEGVGQLREAARLNPGSPETDYNLALALNQQHQWAEAEKLFAKTVTADSPDPNAHYQYAVALAHLNKTREAMSRYAVALLIRPDFPEALDELSWLLATVPETQLRNGTEAVRMAERACELTNRKDPMKMRTLAAAYAETGRFEDAVATASNAQQIAMTAGQSSLAGECQRLMESFKSGKSWRVNSP